MIPLYTIIVCSYIYTYHEVILYRRIRGHGTPVHDVELAEDSAPPSPSRSPTPPSRPPPTTTPTTERNEAYGIAVDCQIEQNLAPVYELMN